MAEATQKAKKGKKGRKHGRNKSRHGGTQNTRYVREGLDSVHRAQRILRHIHRHPSDLSALPSYTEISILNQQRAARELRAAGANWVDATLAALTSAAAAA